MNSEFFLCCDKVLFSVCLSPACLPVTTHLNSQPDLHVLMGNICVSGSKGEVVSGHLSFLFGSLFD